MLVKARMNWVSLLIPKQAHSGRERNFTFIKWPLWTHTAVQTHHQTKPHHGYFIFSLCVKTGRLMDIIYTLLGNATPCMTYNVWCIPYSECLYVVSLFWAHLLHWHVLTENTSTQKHIPTDLGVLLGVLTKTGKRFWLHFILIVLQRHSIDNK